MSDHKTDCTPGHCAYGYGHACNVVTRFPEAFPPGGGWSFAWRTDSNGTTGRRNR